MKITGKVSTFGGKSDTGVGAKEGLALFEKADEQLLEDAGLILKDGNPSRFGLARRLNPDALYIACRWDYAVTPREFLRTATGALVNEKTGASISGVRSVDWGPNEDTGRAMDLSPGLAKLAGLETDDVASFVLDLPGEAAPVTHPAAPAADKLKNPPQSKAEFIFGKVETDKSGQPTERWQSRCLTRIDVPFPMRLSWDTQTTIRSFICHREVKKSLGIILQGILEHYGSPEAIRAARMDLFGGCYSFRLVRGGATLSQHAYGAAIDLDPDHNALGNTNGTMPREVIALFEAQGWTWGGNFSRPDPMHFQYLSA